MDNSTIIKRIADTSPAFRTGLMKECKLHSEKEANGEYYFDEDKNAWVGYTGAPLWQHSTTNEQAKEGAKRDNDIQNKILGMINHGIIPAFLTYQGDPRSFVLKMNADKMSEDEVKLCAELGFMQDWGGDFAIVKDAEWQ